MTHRIRIQARALRLWLEALDMVADTTATRPALALKNVNIVAEDGKATWTVSDGFIIFSGRMWIHHEIDSPPVNINILVESWLDKLKELDIGKNKSDNRMLCLWLEEDRVEITCDEDSFESWSIPANDNVYPHKFEVLFEQGEITRDKMSFNPKYFDKVNRVVKKLKSPYISVFTNGTHDDSTIRLKFEARIDNYFSFFCRVAIAPFYVSEDTALNWDHGWEYLNQPRKGGQENGD